MLLHIFLLMIGILACSFSVILIKIATVPVALLASYRLLLAALFLLPWFLSDMKRHRGQYSLRHLTATILPAVFLALHFITWNVGARMTPAANATLLVNLVPAATPFFLYFLAGELVSRRETAGTIISLAGAALLSVEDFRISSVNFQGDIICLASALLYGLYFALGRRNRRQLSVMLYIVPLYFIAGLTCFIMALPGEDPLAPISWADAGCIAGLALIPTVIGHSLINNSLRFLRGQMVSILSQTQILFGGLLGYVLLNEVPPAALYPAALLTAGGAALALMHKKTAEAGSATGEPAAE